jgi:hypothetical protein
VLAERPFPRRLFVAWNLLGILDFIVAWAMLFIVSNTAVGVWGGSGPGIEAFFRFPESFIPMFGVPFMACLHLIALMQIRGGRTPNRVEQLAPISVQPVVGAHRPGEVPGVNQHVAGQVRHHRAGIQLRRWVAL